MWKEPSFFRFFPRGFRRKLDIFGKKSGGTPNPQVKKVGVTPNLDKMFVSAAARAAEAGGGAPHFLTCGLGDPHFFYQKCRVFGEKPEERTKIWGFIFTLQVRKFI